MTDARSSFDPEEMKTWAPDDARWKEFYDQRVPFTGTIPTKHSTQPLPESFGRNLDTLEKARLWLTNPHNWHESKLFILKWNGLLCTVNEDHGRRLIVEHWDDGLPWCAVFDQRRRRARGERGEAMEEQEPQPQEPSAE